MVESPHKRSRRSDIDMDRRRESPERNSRDARDRGAREERGGRDRYDRDSHRERERRYRSRSRERERDRDRHVSQGRERLGRRDEPRDRDKERDREFGRGSRRDDRREMDYRDSRGSGRGKGEGNRDRDRGDKRRLRDDSERRATRSRSPARDVAARLDAERSPVPSRTLEHDGLRTSKSRTATPPVTFRVGPGVHVHTEDGHQNGHIFKESPGDSDGAQGHTPGVYDSENMDTDLPVSDGTSLLKSKGKTGKQNRIEEQNVDDDEDIVIEEDDSMAAMQAMLGFGGFGTTKQKKVAGNNAYAVRKEKKMEYRQYMNRVGGFNRPLSPSRD